MVTTNTCFTVVGSFKPSYAEHTISAHVMPKMARNRSALHDFLAQGASNRDNTVLVPDPESIYYIDRMPRIGR